MNFVLAMEEQTRIARELEETRRQVEEAQVRLHQEHEEQKKEYERMLERIHNEEEEREKIVRDISCMQNRELFHRVE
jgi:hypothetical protein